MSNHTNTDPDLQLAANVKILRRRMDAKVAEIKRDLAQWLDQIEHPADTVPTSIALLETAFDRYLALHDETHARDLITKAFDRAVQKRRGALQ
jgi:hypothetical protein